MPNEDNQQNAFLSWRSLAMGACSLVLTGGGMAIGLWAESLDKRLNDIADTQRQQADILSQRAGLAPRLELAEHELTEQRKLLREVERQLWRQR